jgi:hypothetical protein
MDVETLLASLGVKRLSEVLSSFGIRLAEPMLIKKTAEARAAELRLLTDAISEADRKLPEGTTITYNKEGLSVVAKTSPKAREMLHRTSARFVATEFNKQFNLEGVLAEATAELKDLNEVPDEKPEPTWTMRFLGYAEGMGDPYLQELWGKVLAGEIQQPGSYSLRTLDVLSAMTQKEAELLVEACQYLVWNGATLFVPRDVHSFLQGSTLNYGAFSHLAEIGLFFQGDMGIHPFRLGSEEVYFGFSDGTALAVTQGQPRPRVEPGLSIWHLTQSGRDLLRFCSWQTPDEYVEKFRDGIRKLNNWDSRLGKISDYSNPKFEESN